MQQLSPSVKTLWSMRLLLITLLCTAGVFAYELTSIGNGERWLPFSFGVWSALVFVVGLASSFIIPPLRYNAWGFAIENDELHVRRGVLTRIYTIAPTARIQHLDVAQNVFERMLELGRLVVYTAGTRGADIVIPGLPLPQAQMLRDHLKNVGKEDAV